MFMEEHRNTRDINHLVLALIITAVFFVVELIGGFVTNSLALLSDAWHMLNHIFALVLSLVAAWFAIRPASNRRTFGYYRAEILAAFLNGILLLGVAFFIIYEAIERFQSPTEVQSLEMLAIAIIGLLANISVVYILRKSTEESLNIKGAFLHVLTDTLGSVGAITAGAIMLFTNWYQADPLISLLISALIIYSSGKLVLESVNVLLEGVPFHIDVEKVEEKMKSIKGVKGVHDLHVWCITPSRMCILSCHVETEKVMDKKILMQTLIDLLKEDFGIDHTTIQLEDEDYPKASSEHR